MVRHNNMVPNLHFHKKWQKRVKLWFNQPMKKIKRKAIRSKKQLQATPKPVQLLRPVINCPSARYNSKVRMGRGFTLQELKQAGINKRLSRTIGIGVDYRRRNRCVETVIRNVQRLKEYHHRLILGPPKKTKQEVVATDHGKYLNKMKTPQVKMLARVVSEEEKKFEAYNTLRHARADAKYLGVRAKRKMSKTDPKEI